jgi:lauroyl/myristoyl acyltransferase
MTAGEGAAPVAAAKSAKSSKSSKSAAAVAPDQGSPGVKDRAVAAALLAGARGLQLLPDVLVYRVAAGIGVLCWLAMPGRRALVRENLGRVCRYLDATGQASPRVRTAARSDRALRGLVRSAFAHWVRTYAESAMAPRYNEAALLRLVRLETPETAAVALGPQTSADTRGRIYIGFHFGAVELAALYAARVGRVPVAGPMETVANSAMRAYFERTRKRLGIGILPLDDAARELTARLARGEAVALVADRVIRGSGSRVELFGAPARLPIGPAVLAAETHAATYVVGMWRTGWGRWAARLDPIEMAAEGPRRDRMRTFLDQEARLLERMVGRAPEQWWSLFFPIWERP